MSEVTEEQEITAKDIAEIFKIHEQTAYSRLRRVKIEYKIKDRKCTFKEYKKYYRL